MRFTRKKKNKNFNRISKRHLFIGGEGDGKCVYANLGGGTGLGNQLFIYAAGIVVKNRTGLPLCLIRAHSNPHSKTNYTKVFKQGSGVNSSNTDPKLKNSKKLHEGQGVYNKWLNKNIPVNKSTNIFLSGGLYQNYESINSALPFMRGDFLKEFGELYPNEFSELKDPNIQKKTACVHVRRGDFVGIAQNSSLEYFNSALALFENNKDIDTLYIISDDIEWCKAQKWITTKKINYFGDPDEIKTLYLMMLCKGGFILSASTYSAWGAMLGADENQQSTIVYPKGWGLQLMFPSRWNMI